MRTAGFYVYIVYRPIYDKVIDSKRMINTKIKMIPPVKKKGWNWGVVSKVHQKELFFFHK